ncbi:hypothetical protein SETIT_8G208300v2 [Setaria italica]|uniref:Uncharacterized protein n=1 Tax=Setaria italica TaxID=4555 RepID=A0A368S9X7_SETIT|nr:hypothetical protein SETIT_8G208300v2 [Setaria italica]
MRWQALPRDRHETRPPARGARSCRRSRRTRAPTRTGDGPPTSLLYRMEHARGEVQELRWSPCATRAPPPDTIKHARDASRRPEPQRRHVLRRCWSRSPPLSAAHDLDGGSTRRRRDPGAPCVTRRLAAGESPTSAPGALDVSRRAPVDKAVLHACGAWRSMSWTRGGATLAPGEASFLHWRRQAWKSHPLLATPSTSVVPRTARQAACRADGASSSQSWHGRAGRWKALHRLLVSLDTSSRTDAGSPALKQAPWPVWSRARRAGR